VRTPRARRGAPGTWAAGGAERTSTDLKGLIRDVPDFPKRGIVFKDITPLLADPRGFASAIEAMASPFEGQGIAKVVGVESRGFLLAAPIALRLGAGLVPVRKKGKLPFKTLRASYNLEYGEDALEIHEDALARGESTLIVDDVLATGGTARAACELVERLGARVAGLTFLIELAFLGGSSKLKDRKASAALTYR